MLKRVCIFGDSIAVGAWDTQKGGWVARLREYFKTSDYNNVTIYNCSVSGDTTDDLLQRFDTEAKSKKPNIIIFAIGINDSYYLGSKDKPSVSLGKFQSNLQKLANQAKKFCSNIIFLGLTPVDEDKTQPIPWETSIFLDQENTILYSNKIEEVCEKEQIFFIKLFGEIDIEDIYDGVHPNSQAHEKIYIMIKDFLIFNNLV